MFFWEEFGIKKRVVVCFLVSGIIILFGSWYEVHDGKVLFSVFQRLVVPVQDNDYQEERYLFVLKIPSIDLYQNVYSINSIYNDVSKNVELLQDSDLDNRLVFLAAHSGSGKATYFNSVVFLEKGDVIFLEYFDRVDGYVVVDKYYIVKNGYFEVGEVSSNRLFLITCSLDYLDRQLVVEAVFSE